MRGWGKHGTYFQMKGMPKVRSGLELEECVKIEKEVK